MRIKEVDKYSSFVKKYKPSRYSSDDDTFIVEEKESEGVMTVSITKDPLKAKIYTATEAYKYTYEHLDNETKDELAQNYINKKDVYKSLTNYVRDYFNVIVSSTVDYGYNSDIDDELILLSKLDLDYITKRKVVVMEVKDTD